MKMPSAHSSPNPKRGTLRLVLRKPARAAKKPKRQDVPYIPAEQQLDDTTTFTTTTTTTTTTTATTTTTTIRGPFPSSRWRRLQVRSQLQRAKAVERVTHAVPWLRGVGVRGFKGSGV